MVLPLGPHAGPQHIVRLRKTGEEHYARGSDRGALRAAAAGAGQENCKRIANRVTPGKSRTRQIVNAISARLAR